MKKIYFYSQRTEISKLNTPPPLIFGRIFLSTSNYKLKFLLPIKLFFLIYFVLSISNNTLSAQNNTNEEIINSGDEFTANMGQLKDDAGNQRPDILYYGSVKGAELYFMKDKFSFVFGKENPSDDKYTDLLRMDMKLLNSNSNVNIQGLTQTQGHQNFYLGHIPNGVTDVPSYKEIEYADIWPNINMKFEHNNGRMQSGLLIKQYGTPEDISFNFEGAENVEILSDGKLKVSHKLGELLFDTPIGFQNTNEVRKPVSVTFIKKGSNISINVVNYITTKEIVILISGESHYGCHPPSYLDCPIAYVPGSNFLMQYWTTYYGGTVSFEESKGMHVDPANNIYITGRATAQDFPTSAGALQTNFTASQSNAIIIKFNSNRGRDWATFYGGYLFDTGWDITTGFGTASDRVFFAGETCSSDFPTHNPGNSYFQGTLNEGTDGCDAFIVELRADNGQYSTQPWATFLGSARTFERASKIAIDPVYNEIYIAGNSVFFQGDPVNLNFPITNLNGAYNQSTPYGAGKSGFIARFNSSRQLIWSTFLGGPSTEITDISVDNNSNIYLFAITSDPGTSSCNAVSNNLPMCNPGGGAFQKQYSAMADPFICKFNHNGALTWSTYFGGSDGDYAKAIVNDINGNTFISGITESINIPKQYLNGAYYFYKSQFDKDADLFVSKFNPSGVLIWSTFYDGLGNPTDMKLDNGQNLYITGFTSDKYFSVKNMPLNYNQKNHGGGAEDGFILMFDKNGARKWATYFGGNESEHLYNMGVYASGTDVLFSGFTDSNNFPVKDISSSSLDYYDGTYNGNGDIAIVSIRVQCYMCPQARMGNPDVEMLQSNLNSDFKALVFPNPSTGIFNLSIDPDINEPLLANVYNTLGQKVFSVQYSLSEETQAITFTLPTTLPKGIYLLKINESAVENENFYKLVLY